MKGFRPDGVGRKNSLSVTAFFSHYLRVLRDLKVTKPVYYYIHIFFVAGAVLVLLLVLMQALAGGN